MKKLFALALALVSGAYLLVVGPMIDPLPIIDEGLALIVLVQSLAALGLDVRRWLPFLGKKMPPGVRPGPAKARPAERTVDI